MDQKQMLKQIIIFNKNAFDTGFNVMTMMQDQTERMMGLLMDQSPWISGDARKIMSEWAVAYKKGRSDFKSGVDESFKRFETFFAIS